MRETNGLTFQLRAWQKTYSNLFFFSNVLNRSKEEEEWKTEGYATSRDVR
jgi:hypothetical protein